MLDYVAILNSGGLVYYEKNFLKQEKLSDLRTQLQQFIKDIFLSHKETSKKQIKMTKNIFEYDYDQKNKLLTVIVYPEMFSSQNYTGFLMSLSELFKKKYFKESLKQPNNFKFFMNK